MTTTSSKLEVEATIRGTYCGLRCEIEANVIRSTQIQQHYSPGTYHYYKVTYVAAVTLYQANGVGELPKVVFHPEDGTSQQLDYWQTG